MVSAKTRPPNALKVFHVSDQRAEAQIPKTRIPVEKESSQEAENISPHVAPPIEFIANISCQELINQRRKSNLRTVHNHGLRVRTREGKKALKRANIANLRFGTNQWTLRVAPQNCTNLLKEKAHLVHHRANAKNMGFRVPIPDASPEKIPINHNPSKSGKSRYTIPAH